MKGYLPLPAAAAYLGRSVRWLRGRLREIPHFRTNDRILFRVADLDGWMESFRVEPYQEPDPREIIQRVAGRCG